MGSPGLGPTLLVGAACMTGGLALAGAVDAVWIWALALALTAVGFGLGETSSLGTCWRRSGRSG